MTRLIVGFGFAAVLLSLPAMARGDGVPRYALEPGMILDYEWVSSDNDYEYAREIRVWVVGRDDAGAARVVLRQARWRTRKESGEVNEIPPSFAMFDVRTNGEIPSRAWLDPDINVFPIFPRLPENAQEAAEGWRTRDDRDGVTVTYKPIAKSEGGEAAFNFEADVTSAEQIVFGRKAPSVFHFGRNRGVVVGMGTSGEGELNGGFDLKAVSTMAPAEMATFGDEMARYFEAREAYREAVRKAWKAGDEVEAVKAPREKARAILVVARAKVTLPEPIALLDESLKHHDESTKRVAGRVAERAELVGKPAPGWGPAEASETKAAADSEINDLSGRPQSLAQYRGKVLVLDFWYRHCGWCMRAMPQVKMLADHYRDQSVAVLGMNNDQDEQDARFVVEAMKLDYPVIRSMDLPQRYGVQGFPTLIIVDQEGKIADIQRGYSPQLFERVSESIDQLLKPEQ